MRSKEKAEMRCLRNKEKTDKMLHSIGVDFPEENTFISFDNSIAYAMANVQKQ